MGQKLRITGWVSLGVLAGALTTVSLQSGARSNPAQMPLEELRQLAAVFGMVKERYVEPVDEKKPSRSSTRAPAASSSGSVSKFRRRMASSRWYRPSKDRRPFGRA